MKRYKYTVLVWAPDLLFRASYRRKDKALRFMRFMIKSGAERVTLLVWGQEDGLSDFNNK